MGPNSPEGTHGKLQATQLASAWMTPRDAKVDKGKPLKDEPGKKGGLLIHFPVLWPLDFENL